MEEGWEEIPLWIDEYEHGLTVPKTHIHPKCSSARNTIYPQLSIYLAALAGLCKTCCGLSPPGYLPTQTTTHWLPVPLRTQQDELVDCIQQLARHARIGDNSHKSIEFEVQQCLI